MQEKNEDVTNHAETFDENLAEAKARKADREAEDARRAEEEAKARKNKDFAQVYPKYWHFIRNIIDENPKAAILYNFIAEHAAADNGALVVSQQILADKMGVSRMTISRYIKYLEGKSVIMKISLSGGVCAYAIDPEMVWKSYSTNKEYATFNTKTLVLKRDLETGNIQKKLMVMMREQKKMLEEAQQRDEPVQLDMEDYMRNLEAKEEE